MGRNEDKRCEPGRSAPHWPGWLAATAGCIRFYSRLPVPRLAGEGDPHGLPDFRLLPRALPLAALAIALPAALVLAGSAAMGLAAPLAATLGVTVLVITTGALHEDGLADTADGLWGGATPERRLEIMKDSRVGSYGAVALGLALLLRVTALAALVEAAGAPGAAAIVLIAAMLSRSEGVMLLSRVPPARAHGASAAVGRPLTSTALVALALAIALGLALTLAAKLPPAGFVVGIVLADLARIGLGRLATRLIGGQTGDIVGASQQIGEIAVYLGFALALGGMRP